MECHQLDGNSFLQHRLDMSFATDSLRDALEDCQRISSPQDMPLFTQSLNPSDQRFSAEMSGRDQNLDQKLMSSPSLADGASQTSGSIVSNASHNKWHLFNRVQTKPDIDAKAYRDSLRSVEVDTQLVTRPRRGSDGSLRDDVGMCGIGAVPCWQQIVSRRLMQKSAKSNMGLGLPQSNASLYNQIGDSSYRSRNLVSAKLPSVISRRNKPRRNPNRISPRMLALQEDSEDEQRLGVSDSGLTINLDSIDEKRMSVKQALSPVPSLHDPAKDRRFFDECEQLLSSKSFDQIWSTNNADALNDREGKIENWPESQRVAQCMTRNPQAEPTSKRSAEKADIVSTSPSKRNTRISSIVQYTKPTCMPILHSFKMADDTMSTKSSEVSQCARIAQYTGSAQNNNHSKPLVNVKSIDTLANIETQVQNNAYRPNSSPSAHRASQVSSAMRSSTPVGDPPTKPLPQVPTKQSINHFSLLRQQKCSDTDMVDVSSVRTFTGVASDLTSYNGNRHEVDNVLSQRTNVYTEMIESRSSPDLTVSAEALDQALARTKLGSEERNARILAAKRRHLAKKSNLATKTRENAEEETSLKSPSAQSFQEANSNASPVSNNSSVPINEEAGKAKPTEMQQIHQFPAVPIRAVRSSKRSNLGKRESSAPSSGSRMSVMSATIPECEMIFSEVNQEPQKPKPVQNFGASAIMTIVDTDPTLTHGFRAGASSPSLSRPQSSKGSAPDDDKESPSKMRAKRVNSCRSTPELRKSKKTQTPVRNKEWHSPRSDRKISIDCTTNSSEQSQRHALYQVGSDEDDASFTSPHLSSTSSRSKTSDGNPPRSVYDKEDIMALAILLNQKLTELNEWQGKATVDYDKMMKNWCKMSEVMGKMVLFKGNRATDRAYDDGMSSDDLLSPRKETTETLRKYARSKPHAHGQHKRTSTRDTTQSRKGRTSGARHDEHRPNSSGSIQTVIGAGSDTSSSSQPSSTRSIANSRKRRESEGSLTDPRDYDFDGPLPGLKQKENIGTQPSEETNNHSLDTKHRKVAGIKGSPKPISPSKQSEPLTEIQNVFQAPPRFPSLGPKSYHKLILVDDDDEEEETENHHNSDDVFTENGLQESSSPPVSPATQQTMTDLAGLQLEHGNITTDQMDQAIDAFRETSIRLDDQAESAADLSMLRRMRQYENTHRASFDMYPYGRISLEKTRWY